MVPAKVAKISARAPDFRRFLQNELVRRSRENPRYSLRAFAKSLGIQSAFLSKILRGQRRVTPETVRRLGLKMGLPLKDLHRYEGIADSEGRVTTTDFHEIALDHFQVISDWYHFAILELASVKNFQPSARWIAATLDLGVAEAQAAIERLERIGYLSIDAQGKWMIKEGHTTTLGSAESAVALQKMQQQILQRAQRAIVEVPIAERDQSAMTMAIDSTLLPLAKEKIKDFRRDLCAWLEQNSTEKDSVYQLAISLYPASKRR